MSNTKIKNINLKTIIITMLGMVITIVLHELWKDPFQDTNIFPPSKIRLAIGSMKPLLGTSLFVLFLLIAFTYNKVQHLIPAKGVFNPFYYGIPAGGLWILGMVEGTPWLNLSFPALFFSGVADLIPIVIICLLLSMLLYKENNGNKYSKRMIFPSIIIIPLFFILVRYFSYYVVGISSGIDSNQLGTFIWTTLMGMWIWVMYYFMGVENWNKSIKYKVFVFGGLIYGIIWISFNGIGALISSDFSLKTILMRSLPDTLAIILATYMLAKRKERIILLQ